MAGSWWDAPQLETYRYRLLTGDPNGPSEPHDHWYEYLLARFPQVSQQKHGRWLSLCCGDGELERYFASRGVFSSCVAADISSEAIERAISSAKQMGISSVEYHCLDLNQHEWEADTYDVVIAQGGVHHISNLDHLFAQVQKCLKPAGVFLMHEYVGASRLRFPSRQVEVINALMHLIPARYRVGNMPSAQAGRDSASLPSLSKSPGVLRRSLLVLRERNLRRAMRAVESRAWDAAIRVVNFVKGVRYGRGPYARLFQPEESAKSMHFDPSESVRSAEILPSLRRYLDIIEVKGMGGTALWWLQDFDWCLNPLDPDLVRLLNMLIYVEETLISIGDLQPDLIHLAARKRAGD